MEQVELVYYNLSLIHAANVWLRYFHELLFDTNRNILRQSRQKKTRRINLTKFDKNGKTKNN